MERRSGSPADRFIGNKVRMQRVVRHKSQTQLADHLGLTFQQVQKYEKGINRVSGGRLAQIAEFLQVPVSFFYDGLQGNPNGITNESLAENAAINAFIISADGVSIAQDFQKLKPDARRTLRDLVHHMATANKVVSPRQSRSKLRRSGQEHSSSPPPRH